jgi:membrane protein YqaA with SNARE-associated domain
MSPRLILWTLFLAYVGFLLASTKSAPSLSIDIIGAFLGAMIGFALGIMFGNRAHRKAPLQSGGVVRHQ